MRRSVRVELCNVRGELAPSRPGYPPCAPRLGLARLCARKLRAFCGRGALGRKWQSAPRPPGPVDIAAGAGGAGALRVTTIDTHALRTACAAPTLPYTQSFVLQLPSTLYVLLQLQYLPLRFKAVLGLESHLDNRKLSDYIKSYW